MQKYDRLELCHPPLHSTRGAVKLFSQSLNGNAVNKTALYNGAVPFRVNVLVDDARHTAVCVFDHAFTRPVPPQVGHGLVVGMLFVRVIDVRFLGVAAGFAGSCFFFFRR